MNTTFKEENGNFVMKFEGRLDTAAAPQVEKEMQQLYECDGHDVEDFENAVLEAKEVKGVPNIIIAKTVKGKGIDFMEGKNTWHGKAIDDASYENAKKCLEGVQ